MQTNFSLAQLGIERNQNAEQIIRRCVHCGFCLATCPTYQLLGDERDSPRGRIYQTKTLLEHDRPVSAGFIRHIDRCLSCLSCMTTCPSGVDYMHLVDEARAEIEESGLRPLREKLVRNSLVVLMTRPWLFRAAMVVGSVFAPVLRPFARGRLRAMLDMIPSRLSPVSRVNDAGCYGRAEKGRVILPRGCVQQVLTPETNEATVRLLNRLGYAVEVVAQDGCCGSLELHMGRAEAARQKARQNLRAWTAARQNGEVAAIVATASGCGTTMKDYGHLLRHDAAATETANLVRDITEFLLEECETLTTLARQARQGQSDPLRSALGAVACHLPCSLQHGQKVTWQPQKLIAAVGLEVREPAQSDLCCGSAGTWNIMNPELAQKLRRAKVKTLDNTGAEIVVTSNVGCLTWIGGGTARPVVHIVELLDWMTGGPAPETLSDTSQKLNPRRLVRQAAFCDPQIR